MVKPVVDGKRFLREGGLFLGVVVVSFRPSYVESWRIENRSIGGLDYSSYSRPVHGAKLRYTSSLESILIFHSSVGAEEGPSHRSRRNSVPQPRIWFRLNINHKELLLPWRRNNPTLREVGVRDCHHRGRDRVGVSVGDGLYGVKATRPVGIGRKPVGNGVVSIR
jgi:hypothetical protein